MSDTTKIEWADATFNPWIGCTKISPGCANCYALNTTPSRVLRSRGHETWGRGAKRARTGEGSWKKPLAWNLRGHHGREDGRIRVFPSLCDWLDEEVPIEWLADFLNLICDTPNLDWLLLTKRPENFENRLFATMNSRIITDEAIKVAGGWLYRYLKPDGTAPGDAPKNVWIGTSVENEVMADKRIPLLARIPARVRFLSVEPMLGPVRMFDYPNHMPHIDWVIFGGESGPKARPCHIGWIRDGLKQCHAVDVPAFVKQLGSNAIDDNGLHWPIDEDKKGGDISQWPKELQVREFPKR